MRSISLRARVAAAAVVAIVVAFVLLAGAVPALLERQLTNELDRSLRGRAVEVARLASATPALLTEPGALEGRLTGGAPAQRAVELAGELALQQRRDGDREQSHGDDDRHRSGGGHARSEIERLSPEVPRALPAPST